MRAVRGGETEDDSLMEFDHEWIGQSDLTTKVMPVDDVS